MHIVLDRAWCVRCSTAVVKSTAAGPSYYMYNVTVHYNVIL